MRVSAAGFNICSKPVFKENSNLWPDDSTCEGEIKICVSVSIYWDPEGQ